MSKPSSAEKDCGLEDFYWRRAPRHPFGFERIDRATYDALPPSDRAQGNVHPTVKGLDLSRYLARLVTPKGGRLADGTCGSGSIPIGAWQEAFDVLACDLSPEAIEIARARLAFWQNRSPVATIKNLRRGEKVGEGQGLLFDLARSPK